MLSRRHSVRGIAALPFTLARLPRSVRAQGEARTRPGTEETLRVAHTGIDTVWRCSARAQPMLAITSCAGASNLGLGGPGGHDLFITESETGSILRTGLESS